MLEKEMTGASLYIEGIPHWYYRSADITDDIPTIWETFKQSKNNSSLVKDGYINTIGGAWHQIRFGTEKHSSEPFRGYLMVEPEDFKNALKKLNDVAAKRLENNKRTEFKWLVGRSNLTKLDDITTWGTYENLEDDDPRIVLYGNSSEEILEILQLLVDTGWNEIEKYRLQQFGGDVIKTPRRPGSNEFVDSNGQYWRSLNWNSDALPSEESFGEGTGRPVIHRELPPRPKYIYTPPK